MAAALRNDVHREVLKKEYFPKVKEAIPLSKAEAEKGVVAADKITQDDLVKELRAENAQLRAAAAARPT